MNEETPAVGSVKWMDLTVPNAIAVKDFYAAVTGWQVQSFQMEGYEDYCMIPAGAESAIAGICHARGANASLPPMWMIYITVASVEASVAQCLKLGGEVIRAPFEMGEMGKFAVIRDPAGACAALFQPASIT